MFISLSCLNAVNWTFNTMLNRNGRSGHSNLVPEFSSKAINSFPTLRISWLWLAVNNFSYVEICHLHTLLVRVFIINGCWILSTVFSESIEMTMFLLMWCVSHWLICLCGTILVTLEWIQLGDVIWSFPKYCQISFANILLRTFESVFIKDIGI